ncbi:MAG: YncE family protein [Acidimicrobiales bacterium]|jgi:hypothetical protein
MVLIPASTAQAVQRAAQATELYVGIGSPAELEVIDAVTGEEVGSPVSLVAEPLALSYWSPVSADPGEVAIAENGDFQVFNPTTGSLTAAASLSFKPSAVAVAAVTSTQQYALVVGGSSPGKVSVINLDDNPPLVVQTFALGFSSGAPSGMAVNTSGTYAFVTDPTSHQIETLEYVVGDPFTISSTYKNSSLDPSSIIFSVADAAIFYSTGDDVDESSVPSGTVSAPSEEISIAESGTSCTSSLSAGALVNDPDGSSSDLYVQEVGSDNVGDVSTTNDDLSACMTAPTFAGGSLAFVNDGGSWRLPRRPAPASTSSGRTQRAPPPTTQSRTSSRFPARPRPWSPPTISPSTRRPTSPRRPRTRWPSLICKEAATWLGPFRCPREASRRASPSARTASTST